MPAVLSKHSSREKHLYTLARGLHFHCCKNCTSALARVLKCADGRCALAFRLRYCALVFLGGRPGIVVADGSAHRGTAHPHADPTSCAVAELIIGLCPTACQRDPTAYSELLFTAANAARAALGLPPLTRCASGDTESQEFKDYVAQLMQAAAQQLMVHARLERAAATATASAATATAGGASTGSASTLAWHPASTAAPMAILSQPSPIPHAQDATVVAEDEDMPHGDNSDSDSDSVTGTSSIMPQQHQQHAQNQPQQHQQALVAEEALDYSAHDVARRIVHQAGKPVSQGPIPCTTSNHQLSQCRRAPSTRCWRDRRWCQWRQRRSPGWCAQWSMERWRCCTR